MIGVSGCVECTRGLAAVYYGALINDYADFFDMGKLASDMWEMCTEVKKHYDRSTASTCQDTLSAGFDCLRTCLLKRVCYERDSPHPKGNLSTQLMWRVVESGYMASASGRCASANIPRVAVMALALMRCMTHDAIDFWSDLTYGEHNNIFCYLYHSGGEAAVSAGVWWASTVLAGLRATYPDIVGYVGASVWWQFYNVRYSAPRQMQYVADRCVGVRVNESSYETILSLDTMLIPLLKPPSRESWKEVSTELRCVDVWPETWKEDFDEEACHDYLRALDTGDEVLVRRYEHRGVELATAMLTCATVAPLDTIRGDKKFR
ncbi:hypothetical protein BGZ91_002027 [Linnemannia elongata]|nr:hypothetical protein BGZ91_002027 [Linnemannia elongata]